MVGYTMVVALRIIPYVTVTIIL